MANPDWLRLDGRRVALLGAASQLGPLAPLARWGADLALVDLPRSEVWERVRDTVRGGAGRAVVPVRGAVAGLDVVADAPELRGWLAELDGPLTIGGYTYLDGARHVLVNAAIDAVVDDVAHRRDDVSLAFLATPTDVFPVPMEAVQASRQSWKSSPVQRTMRFLSRGRLMAPNYPSTLHRDDGRDIGIGDCLVPQQGPNYALAKHLQRWRAAVARATGTPTSMRVAPTTRTQSVMRNRVLAAAYEGGPRFGLEVFHPETASTLMATLLVHDLCNPVSPANPASYLAHPDDQLMHAAAHAGLWRTPYAPRSVLDRGAARPATDVPPARLGCRRGEGADGGGLSMQLHTPTLSGSCWTPSAVGRGRTRPGAMGRRATSRGTFTSVKDHNAKIRAFITGWKTPGRTPSSGRPTKSSRSQPQEDLRRGAASPSVAVTMCASIGITISPEGTTNSASAFSDSAARVSITSSLSMSARGEPLTSMRMNSFTDGNRIEPSWRVTLAPEMPLSTNSLASSA